MNALKQLDYIIIGAGPAGLQMGYYLARNRQNYLILEAGSSAGTFFGEFPRHRKLLSINKVFTGHQDHEINLRWDWNSLLSDRDELLFRNYTVDYFPDAADLKTYLEDFANHLNLNIQYHTEVNKVTRQNNNFMLTDAQGHHYLCRYLIVATGLSTPYVPPIPGIELAENYVDFSIDPHDFINERVLIVGKGNSAFETADNLIATAASIHLCSPHPVKLAWKSHFVGHLRARNNNFLDTYQLKSQNAILDAHIEKIRRENGKFVVDIIYTHAREERRTIEFDRVLVCTGFRFDTAIFDHACRPQLALDERFPAQTSAWESKNVKDLYFAGTLMQQRDYKKTMSAFIHGFRHNIEALSHILEERYHNKPWPFQPISATPREITDAILHRINTGSSLFLQPGYFSDVLVVPEAEQGAYYYRDIPTEYIAASDLGRQGNYYTISLEYGDFSQIADPFYIERDPDPAQAHLTAYLHPIIRHFNGSRLMAEHHIPEDLENNYSGDLFSQLIQELFQDKLNKTPASF
ncbi:MAG: NAD(P)-binding domain-containing protein [Anaerolineae bacterium]|nr:NAD(P)-binding domain-containing protein [Anaerolineae bacterium]